MEEKKEEEEEEEEGIYIHKLEYISTSIAPRQRVWCWRIDRLQRLSLSVAPREREREAPFVSARVCVYRVLRRATRCSTALLLLLLEATLSRLSA